MNIFLRITHFLNGFLLIRFAISKLFAWPISVDAFIEMAKPIGIDPTFFRIFTGIVISTVCLSFFASFYLLIRNKVKQNLNYLNFAKFSNFLGINVLSGALVAEFFLRTEPKWPLVFIAAFIVITSAINFLLLNKVQALK